MLLSEFFNQLAYGELSHLAMSDSGTSIDVAEYEKIVSHVNLGLTEIYSRFDLKTDTVVIQQIPEFTRYVLDSRYAKSNPLNTDDQLFPKYIIDSRFYPFKDNIIKIETVEDELGVCWSINDEDCTGSVRIEGHNIIHTPFPSIEAALFVRYRAKPDNIVLGANDPDTIILDIPPQLHNALLAFVAHRIFAGRDAQSAEAQIYLTKFLEICAFVENQGLVYKTDLETCRLEKKGWV